MKSRDILDAALRVLDISQANVAKMIGWTPQQLSAKLVRNSWKADEFLMIMDTLGVEVKFYMKDDGKELKPHVVGAGRRIRCMVDRVIYDTNEADAIANNFYADGENEYSDGRAMELYVTGDGTYFFAEYTNWDGAKDRITPVTSKDAVAFIEKYGTELHRKPESEEENE